MICFRSLNYFWLISTEFSEITRRKVLWFAFVLWTTFDWYQQPPAAYAHCKCCDLLSFFELLLIDINRSLQNLRHLQLWFAFVLWTTFDWYQQVGSWLVGSKCCDLLSFFELLLIDINFLIWSYCTSYVVICFRSLNYFWLISTVMPENKMHLSCDLLSFFELLLIDINTSILYMQDILVVICFRSLNYFWLISTPFKNTPITRMLWFAFVLWTTFDWYQHRTYRNSYSSVVICFRSLNYFWLISTFKGKYCIENVLWFAFVLWTTFDWYQPLL